MAECLSPIPRSAVASPVLARTGAAIAGTGIALPERAVANDEIAATLDVDDHWIYKRIGVRERRMVEPHERLTDLATAAGRQALAEARLDGSALDLVLVGTFTQDEILPNAAPQVAAALGAVRSGAVDLGAACMGFLSGLALAAGQIEAGRASHVLVIGAEALTRYLDRHDRRTAGLIGDGAGAAVVSATRAPTRIGPCVLRADDRSRELVYMTRTDPKLRMAGQETYVIAVECLTGVTRQAIAAAGLELDEIDLFVYHQANARIVSAVGQRLGLRPERVVNCIEQLGNTSAASIPIALRIADEEGRLADGSTVLLAAIGAGFTWGATVVQWGAGDG